MQYFSKEPLAEDSHELPQKFEALAFPLMDSLYSTALRMTGDQLDAEDLVQNSYLRAYRSHHRFKPGSNFRAWMFRILTNNFINEYRKKKNTEHRRVDFETICTTFEHDDTGGFDWNSGNHINENYEELFDDTVTDALNRLPAKYRMAVLLSDVSEFKYQEIADALNIPVGTVMSRISRDRRILARFLRSYAYENGFVNQNKGEKSYVH